MRSHMLIASVSALSVSSAAVAEPAKVPVQKAAQPADRPAEVLVASVDTDRPELVAAQDSGAPAKRVRKARVNSCRCGGDQPPQAE